MFAHLSSWDPGSWNQRIFLCQLVIFLFLLLQIYRFLTLFKTTFKKRDIIFHNSSSFSPHLVWQKTWSTLLCPDHITRNELSVDESLGEAWFQYAIQSLFYLTLVSTAVRADGPEAATRITFAGLALSYTMSTISLSIGQFKVLSVCLDKSYAVRNAFLFNKSF